RINEEWFEKHVHQLEELIQTEQDMAPLIAHYFTDDDHQEGAFELNDGNHRLEAYSRLGIKEYYVIIWITEKNEYDLFLSKYSKYI
ncbi:MAG: ParB/RepB/Spo0J family partition protein, partial [Lachnospiraceae bacterium]|nr:ParB/RepB/Spo0J family partition protein [Lachnospiraceae bacterium]